MTEKQQEELERLRQEYLNYGPRDPQRKMARHRYFTFKHALEREGERGGPNPNGAVIGPGDGSMGSKYQEVVHDASLDPRGISAA